MNHEILPVNSLDFRLLEPGDLLLVANPSDPAWIRYLLFWSHVGIVGLHENIIDAVREPRGACVEQQTWYHVQSVPYGVYQLNMDILALRVNASPAARWQAAAYAEERVGMPYAPTVWRILWGRRDTTAYSCASLMWQAYAAQGIDLDPLPIHGNLLVIPAVLACSRQVSVIGRGTRYAAPPPGLAGFAHRLER
jgi:uncharacterized protein YycO